MGIISPTQPSTTQPRYTEEQDLADALTATVDLLNGDIDGANAPALFSHYRVIAQCDKLYVTPATAGVYIGSVDGIVSPKDGATSNARPQLIPIVAADHAVTGLTTKIRLRCNLITCAVAPGINFTYGLYPISSIGGGVGTFTFTLGTVVSGTTVTRSTPAANSTFTDTTSDISLPSDGVYLFGVDFSGNLGDLVGITWMLQVRNV